MTAKQVEATCWGKPNHVNRTQTAAGILTNMCTAMADMFISRTELSPQFKLVVRCGDERRLALSLARLPHWVKVKNPKAPAVRREAEEDWGGKVGGMAVLRKMLAHYRMLRFLRWTRWRSAKSDH
jgi:hypothetical protein